MFTWFPCSHAVIITVFTYLFLFMTKETHPEFTTIMLANRLHDLQQTASQQPAGKQAVLSALQPRAQLLAVLKGRRVCNSVWEAGLLLEPTWEEG